MFRFAARLVRHISTLLRGSQHAPAVPRVEKKKAGALDLWGDLGDYHGSQLLRVSLGVKPVQLHTRRPPLPGIFCALDKHLPRTRVSDASIPTSALHGQKPLPRPGGLRIRLASRVGRQHGVCRLAGVSQGVGCRDVGSRVGLWA